MKLQKCKINEIYFFGPCGETVNYYTYAFRKALKYFSFFLVKSYSDICLYLFEHMSLYI